MGLRPRFTLPYAGQVDNGACRLSAGTRTDPRTRLDNTRSPGGLWPLLKSQLPACHMRIQLRPAVTTDGAPLSPVVHLQAALTVVLPAGKSEDPVCGEKETQTRSKIILNEGQDNVSVSPGMPPDLGLCRLFCSACPGRHSLAWSLASVA